MKTSIPIPSAEPTYEEWKQGKGPSKERAKKDPQNEADQIHPQLEDEILGASRNEAPREQIASFERPTPLPDVLKNHVDDVVREVTITDVLNLLRDTVPISESFDDGSGQMHLYQRTHMDETDVAKFNFREQESGLKSLAEFVDQNLDQESDIY